MAASKRPPWLRSSDLRFHRASTRPLSKKGQEDGPLRGRHPVGAFIVSEIVLRAGDAGAVLSNLRQGLMAANFDGYDQPSDAALEQYQFFQALKPSDQHVLLGILNALRCDEVRLRFRPGDEGRHRRLDAEFIQNIDQEAIIAFLPRHKGRRNTSLPVDQS